MLKYYSLASTYLDNGWALHPLSGSLLRFDQGNVEAFKSSKIPRKVTEALRYCENPYELSPTPGSKSILDIEANKRLQTIYRNLSWLRRSNFFCSILYAGFSRPLYSDSISAMDALSNLFPHHKDSESCLQRSLTVAKTSINFKKNGVLFIGAQLPLKSLHAWIIEDNFQPDRDDRQWINYRPLLALTY